MVDRTTKASLSQFVLSPDSYKQYNVMTMAWPDVLPPAGASGNAAAGYPVAPKAGASPLKISQATPTTALTNGTVMSVSRSVSRKNTIDKYLQTPVGASPGRNPNQIPLPIALKQYAISAARPLPPSPPISNVRRSSIASMESAMPTVLPGRSRDRASGTPFEQQQKASTSFSPPRMPTRPRSVHPLQGSQGSASQPQTLQEQLDERARDLTTAARGHRTYVDFPASSRRPGSENSLAGYKLASDFLRPGHKPQFPSLPPTILQAPVLLEDTIENDAPVLMTTRDPYGRIMDARITRLRRGNWVGQHRRDLDYNEGKRPNATISVGEMTTGGRLRSKL